MSARPRVWVTRAQPGAARTAARLEAAGYAAVVAPLLEIRRLTQAEPDLTGVAALAFTSANGVDAFADMTPRRDLPVFTVGNATAARARSAGFVHVRSAQGAVADLAALLSAAGPFEGAVLAPGARAPAADLAALAPDAHVRTLPVYEAVETRIDPPPDLAAVLIHSPRAARALADAWPDLSIVPIVAVISASAASALPSRAEIRVAAHPTDDALLAALGKPGVGV